MHLTTFRPVAFWAVAGSSGLQIFLKFKLQSWDFINVLSDISLTWRSIYFWLVFLMNIWSEDNCDVKWHWSIVCSVTFALGNTDQSSLMHWVALWTLAMEEDGSACFNFSYGWDESSQSAGYLKLCPYTTSTLGCFEFSHFTCQIVEIVPHRSNTEETTLLSPVCNCWVITFMR